MAVSVETLQGLERKIHITVPSEKIESEVGERLKKAAQQAKIDGFRPGKAPMHLIKQRYSNDFRIEVVRELLQPSLFEALQAQSLTPVGMPRIEPGDIKANEDFGYDAVFEVFPEFEVKPIGEDKVELVSSDITDKDVDATLEKLRSQHMSYEDVDRKAKKGDKLVIDFDVFEGDTSIGDKGKARDFEVVLGEGQVVPMLEDALVGAVKDKPTDYGIDFPEDWHDEAYRNKKLTFKVTVKKLMEGKLPKIDEAFAEKLNIKEGGVKALKEDVKGHMARELEKRVKEMNRESIFEAFLALNPFELPKTLIDEEIKHLQHDFYHKVFGHEHKDDEKIPDFPREMFEERATRRVHLGLLFQEYVKTAELKVDKERVEAMIEKSAEAYDSPEQVKAWYHEDSKRMAELEALALEELASERLIEKAKVTYKPMDYEDVINPKAESKEASDKKASKAKPKKVAKSTKTRDSGKKKETGDSE